MNDRNNNLHFYGLKIGDKFTHVNEDYIEEIFEIYDIKLNSLVNGISVGVSVTLIKIEEE